MKLINLIISFAILCFFVALIFVGYKAISYYNANAEEQASLSSSLAASAGEVTEDLADMGADVKEGLTNTAETVLEVAKDKTEKITEELSSLDEGEDEAADVALEEEEEEEGGGEEEAETEVGLESQKGTSSAEESPKKLSESSAQELATKSSAAKKATQPKAYQKPQKNIAKKNTGAYLVVAGSFSTRANATVERKRLEQLGYTPEIVQFRNSKYHSLIAKRTATSAAAKATVKALKAKGVEAFSRKAN